MNWQIYHYDKDFEERCYFMLVDENFDAIAADYADPRNGERKTEAEAWDDCPDFSRDISAAWEVEAKILSMDDELRARYVIFLMHFVGVYAYEPPSPEDIFALIHASAADRCRAALLALRGGS
ncbi:hypothetical protein ACFCP7_10585 [Paenibacillus elgii]